jgi:hypothetical protein
LRPLPLLLAGLLIVLSLAASAGLLVRYPCPTCEGEGLVAELDPDAWKTRWIRRRDLIPVICPTCDDRFKLNLYRRWRDKPDRPAEPPLYKAKNDEVFLEMRLIRIGRLSEMAAVGLVMDEPRRKKSLRPDLLPVLGAALHDEDGKIRRHAIATIVDMNRDEAFPLVLAAARQDDDDDVRRIACQGLGWFARLPAFREESLRILTKMVDDPDVDDFSVRVEAANALFDLGVLPHANVHVEALRQDRGYGDVARKVAIHFRRKDVILLLIRRMSVGAPERSAAVGADLERLTGERFGNDPVKWYRWFEKNRDSLPPQIE